MSFKENYPKVDWSRSTTANGYGVVYSPEHPRSDKKGYFYTHIIIAELHNERFISNLERVHHKDEDKNNNDPNNLQILSSASEHSIIHALNRKTPFTELECPQCKNIFKIKTRNFKFRKKTNKNIFCSKKCSAKFYSLKGLTGISAKIVHGTSNAYGYHKCRCDLCREGTRIRRREYNARVSPRFPKAVKG